MTEINIGDKIKATNTDGTVVTGVVHLRVEDDPYNGMADYLEVGSDLGMYKSDGWEFEVLAPAARVGDLFSHGLPGGSVIEMNDAPSKMKAMKCEDGWHLEIGDHPIPDAEMVQELWTIVYLP